MAFTLTEDHLRRLCQINSFLVPAQGMVFFGLRGCLPANPNNHELKAEHSLTLAETDYHHPRCTLGQWLPKDGVFAPFPGSTVPYITYVEKSVKKQGGGSNQLFTGYYSDYEKGKHPRKGGPTSHDAFLQSGNRPVRRTADDLDYDNDDYVELVNPGDNFHAGWSRGIDDKYSSAGCQVVVGLPHCAQRESKPSEGPWKIFQERAYGLPQQKFPYILLTGHEAQAIAESGSQKVSARLRFGSNGELVSQLQVALRNAGFSELNIDSDFGKNTFLAVLKYQAEKIGPDKDDGIVGPITASALGMNWPVV